MEKKLVKRVACLSLFQLFQAVRFVNREFTDGRTLERGKMPAAPQFFSQIVRQRSQVRSRTDPGAEANRLAVAIIELQRFDFDLLGLKFYRLSFPRQAMRRNAGNFLGGKWRRILGDFANKLSRQRLALAAMRVRQTV